MLLELEIASKISQEKPSRINILPIFVGARKVVNDKDPSFSSSSSPPPPPPPQRAQKFNYDRYGSHEFEGLRSPSGSSVSVLGTISCIQSCKGVVFSHMQPMASPPPPPPPHLLTAVPSTSGSNEYSNSSTTQLMQLVALQQCEESTESSMDDHDGKGSDQKYYAGEDIVEIILEVREISEKEKEKKGKKERMNERKKKKKGGGERKKKVVMGRYKK